MKVQCEKASLCPYAKLPDYDCKHGKEHEETHLCKVPCYVFRDRKDGACIPVIDIPSTL